MSEQNYKELSQEKYGFERGQYSQCCDNCKKTNLVRTQYDNNPEYYTTVFTECECGNELKWNLPVN